MINIDYITEEIEKLTNSEKYNEASDLFLELISNMKKEQSPLLAETYNKYAFFLFNICEYELSILMFQTSYNLGFNKENTINFLYDSFILPNQSEFQTSYETNIIEYQNNIVFNSLPSFNELPIDFMPIGENKYYIFDKLTNQFEGVIDFSDDGKLTFKKINLSDEISDIIIVDDWNISAIHDYIVSINDRLLYYVPSDWLKSLSFLKIPNIISQYCNNVIWVESVDIMQNYFHTNTSVYLPRLYFSINNSSIRAVTQMVEEEHAYRLTPEGRNTSNIILTLGIPSFNRGHRALENILHLMKLPYDAEIELVLSNNCSIKNTEGYNEIEKLTDSRLTYFKFPDNPGQNSNFCQTIHIAKGKYVCLISDEDTINLTSIPHYLSILRKNPNISFAKGRGRMYYNENTGNIYSKGRDAFLKSFLTTNYVTGLIYRTDLFHRLNVYSWISSQVFTNFAVRIYAHSCWSSLYTFFGDHLEDSTPLFIEGDSEKDVRVANISNTEEPNEIAYYSTVEGRLSQHNGFIEILNQFTTYIDKSTYIEAYKTLCSKTFFLINLVKKQYIVNGENWESICSTISNFCVDGILKINFELSKDEQNSLVNYINNHYIYYTKS